MKQNLSDWASIAEIIAAIGVIFSLVFVGLQINEGNQETRAATIQATLDSEMFFQAEILRYADTWEKVVSGADLADGEEMQKGMILYNMMMTINENRYHQFNSGYLESEPAILTNSLVYVPMFNIWRKAAGAKSRSLQFLEIVDSLRDSDSVE